MIVRHAIFGPNRQSRVTFVASENSINWLFEDCYFAQATPAPAAASTTRCHNFATASHWIFALGTYYCPGRSNLFSQSNNNAESRPPIQTPIADSGLAGALTPAGSLSCAVSWKTAGFTTSAAQGATDPIDASRRRRSARLVDSPGDLLFEFSQSGSGRISGEVAVESKAPAPSFFTVPTAIQFSNAAAWHFFSASSDFNASFFIGSEDLADSNAFEDSALVVPSLPRLPKSEVMTPSDISRNRPVSATTDAFLAHTNSFVAANPGDGAVGSSQIPVWVWLAVAGATVVLVAAGALAYCLLRGCGRDTSDYDEQQAPADAPGFAQLDANEYLGVYANPLTSCDAGMMGDDPGATLDDLELSEEVELEDEEMKLCGKGQKGHMTLE
jgi:hypothetical protein